MVMEEKIPAIADYYSIVDYLEFELMECLDSENYERAAELRDEIIEFKKSEHKPI